jgi:predicted DNA-binding mobile mystery protein A
MQNKSIRIRNQLVELLRNLSVLKTNNRPALGWVRSIRGALGMSGRQLAARLGVKPPRITEIEKAELTGQVTVQLLQKVAEALDCKLVYGFVPKTSLEESLRRQAIEIANRNLSKVSHTMRLEDQELPPDEVKKMSEQKVEEWVRNPPRWLWDPR